MRLLKRNKKKSNRLIRFFKSFVSIVVLTSFILIVTLTIKGISTLNQDKVVNISKPVAQRLGINEEQIGEVAGKFVSRLGDTDVPNLELNQNSTPEKPQIERNAIAKVAIFADSHNDIQNLQKAINLSSQYKVDAIFHIGDITNLGIEENLNSSKVLLDSSKIPYYVIPGDRDLRVTVEDSSGLSAFNQVFGDDFHSIVIKGVKFVMLDNAANYTPISNSKIEWFKSQVADADFVLLSQPLYFPNKEPLYGNKIMGISDGEEQPVLLTQASLLLDIIRGTDVKAIIAAEHHHSSSNVDQVRESLNHIVVGAITSTINDIPQKAFQTSRFSILYVYSDGTYLVEEVLL